MLAGPPPSPAQCARMPDHFAALEQPRRPWLDAAALRDSFHRLGAALHPDVAGGDAGRFAALNAAYAVLRDPAARARHLLELEAPAAAASAAPPPELGGLFMQQAALHQGLAGFLAKRAAAGNALSRALLGADETALRNEMESARAAIESAHERALAGLRTLDDAWLATNAARYTELAAIQARLAFLGKWRTQLREMIFQLLEGP